ncbi:MAG: hypothetical protein WKG07_41575 [Hymenobacter sp.]
MATLGRGTVALEKGTPGRAQPSWCCTPKSVVRLKPKPAVAPAALNSDAAPRPTPSSAPCPQVFSTWCAGTQGTGTLTYHLQRPTSTWRGWTACSFDSSPASQQGLSAITRFGAEDLSKLNARVLLHGLQRQGRLAAHLRRGARQTPISRPTTTCRPT